MDSNKSENIPDAKNNYHLFAIGVLVILLSLASIIYLASVESEEKSEIQPILLDEDIEEVSDPEIPMQEPEETVLEWPDVEVSTQIPQIGKSHGIFYPDEGITINNTIPTISGKVNQTNNVYLETKFGVEKSVVDDEDKYVVRFIPGRVKDLAVQIDGVSLPDVYAIPQYPIVTCGNVNLNPDNSNLVVDVYDSESTCLDSYKDEIPPIIIYTKPDQPLAEGQHTLTIIDLLGNDKFAPMNFTVDTNYRFENQSIFTTDPKEKGYYYNSLLMGDNCAPGYYYDTNSIKLPLVYFNNPNLYYGLAFPQSKEEERSNNIRKVQIVFEGKRYDIFFPNGIKFFEGKSPYQANGGLNGFNELYLPKDHLVFRDGRPAMYANPETTTVGSEDFIYISGYFEIYPIDVTGGIYHNSTIPRTVSGSSSCDG